MLWSLLPPMLVGCVLLCVIMAYLSLTPKYPPSEETLVLVVGGSSFIAQHLIQALLREPDYPIRVASTFSKAPVAGMPSDVQQFVVNMEGKDKEVLASLETVYKRIGVPTVVINCVGLTSLKKSERHKDIARKLNVPSALITSLQTLPHKPYLIQMSTDKVFKGDPSHKPYPESEVERLFTSVKGGEWAKHAPPNEYGRSKLRGEHLIMAAWERYTILRLSVVLGAHPPYAPKTKFLAWLHDTLTTTRKPVEFFTDEKLNFVFMDDIIRVVKKLISLYGTPQDLAEGGPVQQAYNFGGAETLSRAQLALKAAKVLGVNQAMVKAVPRAHVAGGGRGGAKVQSNTAMDVSLIQEELSLHLTPTDTALAKALNEIHSQGKAAAGGGGSGSLRAGR